MSQHFIQLVDVQKAFGKTTVLDNINLYIDRNEFLTLLGPSGCGKTTTLRIIGGFEMPTSGDLLFEGKSFLGVPPHKRKVNTIFQRYALFPHLNVEDNVAFGLKIQNAGKAKIQEKVAEMLKLVNMADYPKRAVTSLSGGQQQRVAIARALANEPSVLLLDEPLGALDLKLRKEMQIELKRMQQQLGITFVYVTHDQEEALSMSDTIAVMDAGRILQIGRPEDIYNEPQNAFVAQFIGESNLLPGVMREDLRVAFAGAEFKCIDKGFDKDEAVDVVVRPEDVVLVAPDDSQKMLTGRVRHVTFKGVHYEMLVACDGNKAGNENSNENEDFMWKIHSTLLSPVDTEVGLSIAPDLIHVMRRDAP